MHDFRYLWSRVATRFDAADRARVHNILVAAERVQGTVLLPEKEFSFNAVVGSRQERGSVFEEAPVFTERGRLRAAGGGVCQVSSTLYVAVLSTNLEVVERHAHVMPVPYLAPGMDATVSSRLDFRVRNPHSFAVQFRLRVQGNRLLAEVWGEKPMTVRVNITREVRRCIRDNVPGLQVVVWRVIRTEKTEVRQKMSEDVYYLGR